MLTIIIEQPEERSEEMYNEELAKEELENLKVFSPDVFDDIASLYHLKLKTVVQMWYKIHREAR